MRFGNANTRFLLSGCLALAAVVAIELIVPPGPNAAEMETPATVPTEPKLERAAPFQSPPMAAYDSVLERPLFFANRRLPEQPAQEEPATPLRLRLEGVALVGPQKVAVLRSLADRKIVQLVPGASHDGWKLVGVSADSAEFERGNEKRTLALEIAVQPRR